MKKYILRYSILFICLFMYSSVYAAEDSQNGGTFGYDNGLFLQTKDDLFKLKINLQLQPQYQSLVMDGQSDVHTFQLRRGRLIFSGHALTKNLSYKFQYEAIGGRANTTRRGEVRGNSLRDAYINYAFTDEIQILFGQFKPFYNREEQTSSSKLQFVDRSISNDVFTFARDLGVALHGKVFDKKLEWGAFLTNEGVGRNTTNANNSFLMGGRLAYNILGSHGYTMSDVNYSEDPQLALGVAANFNKPAASGNNSTIASTGDLAFRYKGFSALTEGHFVRDTTASVSTYGVLGQAGYFIVPKKFEVAARATGIFPTGNTKGYEIGGGLNYFFKGHNTKLQADYAMLLNSPLVFGGAAAAGNIVTAGGAPGFIASQNDHRLRLQMQFLF